MSARQHLRREGVQLRRLIARLHLVSCELLTSVESQALTGCSPRTDGAGCRLVVRRVHTLYTERTRGDTEADEFRAAVEASPKPREFVGTDGGAIVAPRDPSGSPGNVKQLSGLTLAGGVATAAITGSA